MCRAAIPMGTVTVPAKDWASQQGRKRNEEQATHDRTSGGHEKQVFIVIRAKQSAPPSIRQVACNRRQNRIEGGHLDVFVVSQILRIPQKCVHHAGAVGCLALQEIKHLVIAFAFG